MITCVSCGSILSGASPQCPKCGEAVSSATVALETVALPAAAAQSARARTSPSSTSRPQLSMAIPDEGRFIPGTLIAGRYRVIGLLGRGGMGEVYRATDLTLAQSVALKFLPEDAGMNQRLLERFHNEVRIARQVSHPNVCRVYDIGEADGVAFISMEYVDGEDLSSLLQRIGRLPGDKALETARKICAGVAAAHERGIIHRDLKPHNIMLNRRGEVVVMDFGLAAIADELRGAEARNGTPAYMSPEQLRGDSVTPKSDIYALGLIIYELFTGRRAFDAESMQELMRMQESGRPASVSSVASDADPAVERVILRCLQPDPAQRPASALSVAAALPGGDPLSAALAAGEMPSPELVAASGKSEGVALRYAVACLAAVLLGVLALPFITQPMMMLSVAPMELPPPVLEQKAREHAAALGYTSKPVDWKSWLNYDREMVAYLEKSKGPRDWPARLNARNAVELVYRQSPRYLLSHPDGAITLDRPPFTVPGMIIAIVDARGRLNRFEAVPPREDPPAADSTAPDINAVFRAAGLDPAQFREIPATYVPLRAFDARRAWTGAYPGLKDVPVTVEVASYGPRVTSMVLRFPWTSIPMAAEPPGKLSDQLFNVFSVLCVGVGVFCVGYFARRSLKQGRGDRHGATRLAYAALLLFALAWAARRHVVPRLEMLGYAFEDLSIGLAVSALLWLAYIALEPAVRSRWPHSLITWNRLIAGQIADPRVGSHILIGAVVGMVCEYIFLWRFHWAMVRGGPPDPPNLDMLLGPGSITANLLMVVYEALQTGIVIFFVLCGLRALLRRDWAAALVASVLLSAQEGGVQHSMNPWVDVPLYVIIFAVFAFMLLRMGLVPAMVGILTINLVGRAPIGPEFSTWYNGVGALVLSLVAAIAIYGFWCSQREPPVRRRQALLA